MPIQYSRLRSKLRALGRFRKLQRTGKFPMKMKAPRSYGYRKNYGSKARRYLKAYKAYKPRNSAYGGYTSRKDKERVMLPWRNFQNGTGTGYEGQLPGIASPYAGNVSGQISLKVLQTGENLTSANDTLNTGDIPGSVQTMGGFLATSGVENINGLGEIVGKSAILTSSFIRFTITMDAQALEYPPDESPTKVFSYALPHDFRVMIVRAKRQNSVDTSVALSTNSELNTPALRSNLFIDENGNYKGLADDTSVADLFNWQINKAKWECVHQDFFTLKAMVLPYTPGNTGSGVYTRLNLDGTPRYPSQKTIKHYLNVPKKKVDFGFQDSTSTPPSGQPVNFNYVYHTVVLCRVQSSTSQVPSATWNIQANGSTALLD